MEEWHCSACRSSVGRDDQACATCGEPLDEVDDIPTTAAPAPPKRRGPSLGVSVVALVLNLLVWPGLGSLIAGRMRGLAQGSLVWLGLLVGVAGGGMDAGIPLAVVGWVVGWLWAVGTGIVLVQEASERTKADAIAAAQAAVADAAHRT